MELTPYDEAVPLIINLGVEMSACDSLLEQ